MRRLRTLLRGIKKEADARNKEVIEAVLSAIDLIPKQVEETFDKARQFIERRMNEPPPYREAPARMRNVLPAHRIDKRWNKFGRPDPNKPVKVVVVYNGMSLDQQDESCHNDTQPGESGGRWPTKDSDEWFRLMSDDQALDRLADDGCPCHGRNTE